MTVVRTNLHGVTSQNTVTPLCLIPRIDVEPPDVTLCVRIVQTKPYFLLPTPAMLKCDCPLLRHVPK